MTAYPLFCKVREVEVDGVWTRALVPDNRISEDQLAKVWLNRTVQVTTETARNYDQLKLLWAICEKIAQNTDRFKDRKHVMREIKMNTGHVEREDINIPGLGIVFREWPASIRYEAMKQVEWAPWLDMALAYIRSDIFPGMPESVLKAEINDMLGDETLWPERKEPKARSHSPGMKTREGEKV